MYNYLVKVDFDACGITATFFVYALTVDHAKTRVGSMISSYVPFTIIDAVNVTPREEVDKSRTGL